MRTGSIRMYQLPLPLIWVALLTAGCSSGEPPAPATTDSADLGAAEADLAPAPPPLPSRPSGPLYPVPLYVQVEDAARAVTKVCVDTQALAQHATLDALLVEVIGKAGLGMSDPAGLDCQWNIRFLAMPPSLKGDAATAWAVAGSSPERYVMVPDARTPDLQIYAASEAAGLYALRRALSLLATDGGTSYARAATVIDTPGFSMRGVIESYYGTPYTVAQRQTLLGLMSQLLMNTYVYSPKGDDYCYSKWYAPYPADQAVAVSTAAAYARSHFLTYRWGISPAWTPLDTSIKFSSDQDLATLSAKLDAVRALGVNQFAVLLDDLAGGLYWPEDQARFTTTADAHVYFLNRVLGLLKQRDPAARLLVVGSDYTNEFKGWQDYNTILGQGLLPDIDVMWTGPHTYSTSITAADLLPIDGLLKRNVVLWDNAPTTLGPLIGRMGDLILQTSGYLFNPVINQAGFLPASDYLQVLGPQGDFLWNPNAYTPIESFVTWYSLH